ncbi:MAG: FadR family transcriptional regulator [Alphaproteobacteria bacterium]|nr:FadR family transcriptional regulator [Alphaproteobacteria bacterium]
MKTRVYSQRSLHGQVVHELGRRIVSGEIAEGAVLPNESELGDEFEVSRTALREGVKVLAAKGLLSSRTRTGTRVRPRQDWSMLDPDVLAWRLASGERMRFLRDLSEFRMGVEPVAAGLAAARASAADIQELSKAYAAMCQAGAAPEEGLGPDIDFHLALLRASGNDLMSPVAALIETTLAALVECVGPDVMEKSLPYHETVLAGVADRDPRKARAAMWDLLEYSIDLDGACLSTV